MVVNPPYVPTPEDVVGREGIASAWAGGENGRSVIDKILPIADKLLSERGWLYMVTLTANNPSEICLQMREKGYASRIVVQRSTEEESLHGSLNLCFHKFLDYHSGDMATVIVADIPKGKEDFVHSQERDRLLAEIENLAAASDGQRQKMHKAYAQKLKSLETQILDLKKKQDCQLQLLKQKQRSDEAAKRLPDEIKTIKVQKVQLQHKIKQEAEQFRQWKASHEKELLQLRKEGRRNQYEQHKLQALNQHQKMACDRPELVLYWNEVHNSYFCHFHV
ncbi:hypothetical protein ACSBR1_011415 [Camellia fascicularis]